MDQLLRTEILPFIQKLFRKAFDIREGEGLRASLMLFYIFLVISSLLIIKPVCNSLFLSRFGVEKLPYAFILVAVFAASVSGIYSKLLKKQHLIRLIIRTIQLSIASLFVFWVLIYFHFLKASVLYIFYVWVAIFAVITTSQFWLLANLIFNAREAKRLIGFIGSGAIAGGIFGGYLTNFLAPIIGSEHLIFVCIGFLSLCIPIIIKIWKENSRIESGQSYFRPKPVQKINDPPLKLIAKSRHLTYLASIVGISVLVAKLAEFQFSAIASAEITNDDQLTAFFGFWLSNLNIASLSIQLFLTRRVVGVFGVGTSLFFLPAGIFVGALAILVSPALWSAILIKLSDGSLKQSINKAGMELLALPIPVEIKNNAKTFIDVFVDSFATGLSGVLLYFLTTGLDFSVRHVSAIIILLLVGWFFLVTRIRHEYIHSFRLKIDAENGEGSEQFVDVKNESVFGGLIKILEGDDEKQILKVLKMVKEVRNERLQPCFRKLVHHPSSAVQLEVLRNLYFYKNNFFISEVEPLIWSENFEVKTEALRYLFQHYLPENRIDMLNKYLAHEDSHIQAAALLCAAQESRNNLELKKAFKIRVRIEENLKSLKRIDDESLAEFIKITSAKSIGAANIAELHGYLHILLKDQSQAVLKEAILAAGQTSNKEFVPIIFRYWADKALQDYARQALTSYGPEIMDILAHIMNDLREERNMRLHIPKIIASIGVQKSVAVLMANLEQNDLEMRYEVIKALNLLRTQFPHLKFDERHIIKHIFAEAKGYVDTLAMLYTQINAATNSKGQKNNQIDWARVKESRQSLIQALEQKLDNNLDRIFRLLGLKYPPEDIFKIYQGIRGDKSDLRVNAVEFLDNVLEANLKKVIIPIVETTLVDAIMAETLEQFNSRIPSEYETLSILLSSEDNLLKTCAVRLIGELRDDRYASLIAGLIDSPDTELRKSAEQALQKIGILEAMAG